jgi:hypothetical protein
MKKSNKKKTKNKSRAKVKGANRKNLSIVNRGDEVVIRNRSTIAASVFGVIILGLCAAGIFTLRDAWELPMFWLVFSAAIVGVVYSFAKMLFSKIVLNSPDMTMTVYNPFPIQYKFVDINYIDQRTERASDGTQAHVVTVYIGDGKRSVEIVSFSKDQAGELASLLRGMLDLAVMLYPEGDEESFERDEEETEDFHFLKRKKKSAVEKKVKENGEDDGRNGEAELAATVAESDGDDEEEKENDE